MWFVARSGAARRAVSGLLLAALVGLAGGVVLTAWAGARRTDTAFTRLGDAWNHPDLLVTNSGGGGFDPSIALTAPGVASAQAVDGFAAVSITPEGGIDLESSTAILAPVSSDAYYTLDTPVLAEGRLPDPDAADEVMVPEARRDAGYPIGSVHDICVADFQEVLEYQGGLIVSGVATLDEQRAGVAAFCDLHQIRVVGVTKLSPDEVVLRASSEAETFVQGTPAFVESVTKAKTFNIVLVDLEPGADVSRYVDTVVESTPAEDGVSVQSSALRTAVVDRTIEPYVRTLALFALVTALAAIAVLGPAVVRWAGTPEPDREPLVAVGLRPHQLRLASAIRGAALGLVAALLAGGIAAAVSGRFPIGVARRIEPDPGIRLDGVVLAIGFAAVVLVTTLLGAVAASRIREHASRPSHVAEALQGAGVGLARVAGVRAALVGDRRGGGAVRAAGGVAIAIVTVVTALTYEAGLGRLLDTPERYGWTWGALIDTGDEGIPPELAEALANDRSVTGTNIGNRTDLLRAGANVQTFAFDPQADGPYPTLLDGRRPTGPGEIALGGQTLDRLDIVIGDQVTFRAPNGQQVDLTVVGQTLLPLISLGQDLSVAEGGLVDLALIPEVAGDEGGDPGIVLIGLAPGTTPQDLQEHLVEAGLPPNVVVEGPEHTADLRGYQAVRRTPLLLAGILGLLGVGVLAHSIADSPRRRRRELAVLRCIGFLGRDLRSTVRWSALTVVAVSLVIAVPIGLAVGRTLWTSFASSIGLEEGGVTPLGAVGLVIAATVLCALVLAAIPARQASRVRPGEVLHSE